MAHTGIFATSDEIMVKCGENVDATGDTEARINALCLQVESYINCTTRYNWSDAYAGLNADVKGILSMCASDMVASYLIAFNMSGYTSRLEAQTMLDVLRDRYVNALKLLEEMATKDFMIGA